MQHPWFLHDLPPGTLDVNTQLQSTDTERYAARIMRSPCCCSSPALWSPAFQLYCACGLARIA